MFCVVHRCWEIRQCVICGGDFTIRKNSNYKMTCSKKCARKHNAVVRNRYFAKWYAKQRRLRK